MDPIAKLPEPEFYPFPRTQRGRTLRMDRNGKVYFQTMLPNGNIEWRFRFGRRAVVATAEELFTHFARLQGGELFPESISP